MKQIIAFLFSAILLVLCGCGKNNNSSGKTKVVAGLPPIAGLAEIIAGDRAEVITILPQGRTPHDFAPRTDTIRQTSGASAFFTTKMPFENKVASFMSGKADICDVSSGIERIAFHDGGDHQHQHHDGCSHDDHDPHIWLSCRNAIIIADNIRAELTKIDPEGEKIYQQNFEVLKKRLQDLDAKITKQLAPFKKRTFFVYHPAFGYFAHDYQLNQRAIELNGREATPVQLANIIKEAKENGASTIFVQEQFNPRSAQSIAKEINGTAAALDPLAHDLIANLEKIAASLADGFNRERK
ncbi:MAG: hypothetical protein E7050_02230 [Lentisphaerae bacterium]|nr:hypothetical protein [Lentisphaerota bacterium]